MNMTCKVAMDLAELYKADLVSEESAQEIRTHLKGCPDCRRYYREYDLTDHAAQSVVLPCEELSGMETRLYANLSKRLAHRRVLEIIGTSAAIGAGTIMLAIGVALMTKTPNGKI